MTARKVTITVDLSPAGAKAVAQRIGDGALLMRCNASGRSRPIPASEVEEYLRDGWPERCAICGGALEVTTAADGEGSS